MLATVGCNAELAGVESAIARLRDVYATRLWVLARTHGNANPNAATSLRALGLSLLTSSTDGGTTDALYGYDIASYKQTPDWLSPKDWAHPELWNKFRW